MNVPFTIFNDLNIMLQKQTDSKEAGMMRRNADVVKLCGTVFCAGVLVAAVLPTWIGLLLGASVLILCLGAN